MRVNYIGFFDLNTLQKGYRYATDEKITNLTFQDDLITANVKGSRNFQVRLNLEDKHLKSSTCNCPLQTGCCKHAAAIVLYLDEQELLKMTGSKP